MRCKVCKRGRDAVPCPHGRKRSECRECWRIRRKASRDRAKARAAADAKFLTSDYWRRVGPDVERAVFTGGTFVAPQEEEKIDRQMLDQLAGHSRLTPKIRVPATREDTALMETPPASNLPVSSKTHRCEWCRKRDAKKGRAMIPHPRSGAVGMWCEKCVP